MAVLVWAVLAVELQSRKAHLVNHAAVDRLVYVAPHGGFRKLYWLAIGHIIFAVEQLTGIAIDQFYFTGHKALVGLMHVFAVGLAIGIDGKQQVLNRGINLLLLLSLNLRRSIKAA